MFFSGEGRGMYYEEKWIDGWLWCRREVDGQWLKASRRANDHAYA